MKNTLKLKDLQLSANLKYSSNSVNDCYDDCYDAIARKLTLLDTSLQVSIF